MPEKKPTRTADLDYFYGQSSELFSFYRIPKLLFQDSRFQPLSTDAKTLYGILLDRMSLSARNGWLDKAGRVFIIYTVQEVQDSLGCADKKATKLLRELEEYGLIERKRRGLGKPDLIYVKNFSSESSKTPYMNRDNDDSGAVQNTLQDPAKLRCNKTERNNTEVSDLLLSQKKTVPPMEIVQNIWPEEMEDAEVPGKNMKYLIYRLRQAFSLISDEQLVLSTAFGYQLNPNLHITTDFQKCDELTVAAAKATSVVNKVGLMEKAVELYQGKLLSSAEGEHWLVHTANRYHFAYMSTANELLKQLMTIHAYDLIHQYAALALTIAPENTKAYYWLIQSYLKQNMEEMATGELVAARQKLPDEEYQKLLQELKK